MRGDPIPLLAFISLGALASCVRPPAAPAAPARAAPTTLELPLVALVPHDTLPPGTIRGRLEILYPNVSTAGASVELPDAGLSARVDSTGAFELRGVPAGRQRLRARRFGFNPTVGSIDVPARVGSAVRIVLEVQTVCLDYCQAKAPRPFGRIEAVP